MRIKNKKVVLENGLSFEGYSFGADTEAVCEVIFDTSMTGYQEIISDQTYSGQAVVMTYPLIGNYGITDDDNESKQISIGALIVRDHNETPSNFRYTKTLAEVLEESNVPAISGVDTRYLASVIRDSGSMKALITSIDKPEAEALKTIKNFKDDTHPATKTSTRKKHYLRTASASYSIVVLDFGIKHSIINELKKRGCNLTLVPWNTTADDIIRLQPDGILLSNGPGDPSLLKEVIKTIKKLQAFVPMFGIGLGHQLLCLSYGAESEKMHHGRHGSNYPVMNIKTGKVEIVAHNHNYSISSKSIAKTRLGISFTNVLDNSTEGVECEEDMAFSVQFYPGNTTGSGGDNTLYDKFIKMMENGVQ